MCPLHSWAGAKRSRVVRGSPHPLSAGQDGAAKRLRKPGPAGGPAPRALGRQRQHTSPLPVPERAADRPSMPLGSGSAAGRSGTCSGPTRRRTGCRSLRAHEPPRCWGTGHICPGSGLTHGADPGPPPRGPWTGGPWGTPAHLPFLPPSLQGCPQQPLPAQGMPQTKRLRRRPGGCEHTPPRPGTLCPSGHPQDSGAGRSRRPQLAFSTEKSRAVQPTGWNSACHPDLRCPVVSLPWAQPLCDTGSARHRTPSPVLPRLCLCSEGCCLHPSPSP